MAYYAHIYEMLNGEMARQTVRDHLIGTAQRAGQCLRTVGLEKTGYLAGLLHDMGKYSGDFQQYLAAGDGKRGSVIHTFQGCRYLMEKYHRDDDELPSIFASELIAFAIAAHHGLFDCVDSARRIGMQYRSQKQDMPYEEAVAGFLSEIPAEELEQYFSEASKEINRIIGRLDAAYTNNQDYAFEVGVLARLILSSVIEGDRRDTAMFMKGASPHTWPENMAPLWEERLAFLEEKLAKLSCSTPVEKARHSISKICRTFAAKEPGIYRLNVPTGGGKTLSSLRYALAHAKQFNKRRIIFTSPLLSVLEQNASVIHKFVGDDSMILEHHSNVVQTKPEQGKLDERELLAESWDAPIIITTLVQFLNTLFDGKTTAIRRFQALCDSVIIIDEVQTVPAKLLTLFNLAIQFLSEQCRATVVLCSATQPYLEKAAHPIRCAPAEMVPHDKKLWDVFRRTELRPMEDHPLDELPALIRTQMETIDSQLVVCNQKKEAAFLLNATQLSAYRSFHLSAAMCMQHRRDTLAALQDALSRHEKVLCVATQVIEAGVDISFDSVLRLMAGMDSVVQAAGRCNRNGESDIPRPVFIVNCPDEKLGMLRDIQCGKDASIELIDAFQRAPGRFDGDLSSDASIRYYYQVLYRNMKGEEQDCYISEQGTTLFDLLATNEKYADEECENIESFFLRQAFKTAGQYFSVFDEDTTDVLVPYGKGRQLVEELCSTRSRFDLGYRASVLKEMSNYTVSVYQYQKKQLEENHALIPVCDGCVLVLADGFYDDEVGLTMSSDPKMFWEV